MGMNKAGQHEHGRFLCVCREMLMHVNKGNAVLVTVHLH